MPASILLILQHLPALMGGLVKMAELVKLALDEDRELSEEELNDLAAELEKARVANDQTWLEIRAKLQELANNGS